jgi:hypothetical protein
MTINVDYFVLALGNISPIIPMSMLAAAASSGSAYPDVFNHHFATDCHSYLLIRTFLSHRTTNQS